MRAGNRALLYLGGGYVDSKLTSRYRNATGTLEESETKGGFRVSGGGELGFGKNVFGRLELRYQDLGNYNVFGVPTGFARTNTQIVAGLGARF
jgi:outer membrane immunogenic protein